MNRDLKKWFNENKFLVEEVSSMEQLYKIDLDLIYMSNFLDIKKKFIISVNISIKEITFIGRLSDKSFFIAYKKTKNKEEHNFYIKSIKNTVNSIFKNKEIDVFNYNYRFSYQRLSKNVPSSENQSHFFYKELIRAIKYKESQHIMHIIQAMIENNSYYRSIKDDINTWDDQYSLMYFSSLISIFSQCAIYAGVDATFVYSEEISFFKKIHSKPSMISNDLLKTYIYNVTNINTLPHNSSDAFFEDNVDSLIVRNIDHITSKKLANLLNISTTTLHTKIKKFFGLTPTELINKKRISIACQLLMSTKMKISDISELIGFYDSSYFIKVFKQELQATPTQYREKMNSLS